MCHFITAVLPCDARSPELEALVTRHRLSFTPCQNVHVQAQLRPGENYVHGTRGNCDCGSPLFFGAGERSSEVIEREVRKFRKKGWSEAKIARWVASTGPRPHQATEWRDRCWTVGQWADFLDQALALPRIPYVGILGHWYSGDVGSDEFTIAGRVSHAPDELRNEGLGVLDQDVIHDFRRRAPGAA